MMCVGQLAACKLCRREAETPGDWLIRASDKKMESQGSPMGRGSQRLCTRSAEGTRHPVKGTVKSTPFCPEQ